MRRHLLATTTVALLLALALPALASAAPIATASITDGAPDRVMIGASTTVTVEFDNTSAVDTGFGPYLDLVVDTNGADGLPSVDGLVVGTPTFAGSAVTGAVNVPCTGAPMDHPAAHDGSGPLQVTCPSGHTLVYVPLPFGSFAPDQPAAEIELPLTVSNLADLGVDLDVTASGGYRFGADPLDNPADDPTITGAPVTEPITPTVLDVRKEYVGPEHETATGPNYPRSWTIDVDVADGQTISTATLIDSLPTGVVFVGAVASGGGIASGIAPGTNVGAASLPLIVSWPAILGGPTDTDETVTVSFYVPRTDGDGGAVLGIPDGSDRNLDNQATMAGDWSPIDARDSLTPLAVVSDHDPDVPGDQVERITAEALAIQKGWSITTDVGAAGLSPGDILTFTLDLQVSDYYPIDQLEVVDEMSNGLRRVAPLEDPTLQVNGHGFVLPSSGFAPGNYDYSISPTATADWTFRIDDELLTRGRPDDVLLGGCIDGTPAPDCTTNDGATTLRITYRAEVQDEYDPPVTGTVSIDPGDGVSNDAEATARVLEPDTLADSGSVTDDDTSESGRIEAGALQKRIYAVNGSTAGYPFTEPDLRPGDTVTYYIGYGMPTGDVEDLRVDEYLPQPVLDVGELTGTVNATKSWTVPAAGAIQVVGPGVDGATGLAGDTFSDTSGDATGLSNLVPAFTADAVSNAFRLTWGDYSDPTNASTRIAFLVTLTIGTEPFADDLLLTNQAQVSQTDTNGDPISSSSYDRFHLREPEVLVQKGVAGTDRGTPAATYPAAPRPTAFTQPPAAPSFSGTVTPTIAATLDANVANLDADDWVRYVVTYRNEGGHAAHELNVCDTLPDAGFDNPSATNLTVTDGTGAARALAGDFFDCAGGGATLVGTLPGADDGVPGNDAASVLVVIYDVRVDSTASVANAPMVNDGRILQYTNSPGGPDFVGTTPIDDPAQATVNRNPALTKTLLQSSSTTTTDPALTIGERAQYRVRIYPREGVTSGLTLRDTLDAGLRFADLGTYPAAITAVGAVSCAPTACGSVVPTVNGTDSQLTAALGTVTNAETGDNQAGYLELTYWAVLVDTGSNSHGATNVRNSAVVTQDDCGGGGIEPACPGAQRVAVNVVVPQLSVTKNADVTTIDTDNPVNWTIDVANAAGRPRAFDVELTDLVPAALDLAPASVAITGPGTPGTTYTCATLDALADAACTITGNDITIGWDVLDPGATGAWRVTFQTTIDQAQSIAGADITNSADLEGLTLDPTGEQCATITTCNERTLTASGSDTVSVPVPTPSKSILSTSAAHTAGQDVVIGEQVTYQVVIPVPEGTTENLTLVDTLTAGMSFVSGSVTTEYDDDASVGGPLAPVVPVAGPSFTANTMSIDFGDFVVTDSDADAEQIVITYTVAVRNIAGNQATGVRDNSVVVAFDDPDLPGASNPLAPVSAPDLTIVEPVLTIAKSLTNVVDTGRDLVRVDLLVTNTSTVTAFDVAVSDDLAGTGLEFIAPPAATCTATACDSGPTLTGTTVDAVVDALAGGATRTVTFHARIAASHLATTQLDNDADVTWTSLPGTPAITCESVGDCAERTGSGAGPNDYAATDDAQLATAGPSIAKSITATSAAHTSGANVVVGERITYEVVVTVPTGTLNDVRVVDTLQRGLAFAAAAPTITTSGFTTPPVVTLPPVTAAITDAGPPDGQDRIRTFDLGTITNADIDTTPETITITYDAVVVNTDHVQDALTLDNSAELLHAPTGPDVSAGTDTGGTLTVREPVLQVTKTITPTQIDAGQVATITLVISHTGASTADALGVRVVDPLPVEMRTAGVAWVSGFTANCDLSGTGAPSGAQTCDSTLAAGTTLEATYDTIPLGATRTIEFDVMIDPTLAPGAPVSNTGYVEWRSQPVGTGDASPCPTAACVTRTGDYTDPDESDDPDDYTANSTAVAAGATISSIQGNVWDDADNDGTYDGGEACIDGVTVRLTGTDTLGNPVDATALTGGDVVDGRTGAPFVPAATMPCGEYRFDGLRPGTYTVTETTPAGYLDGREGTVQSVTTTPLAGPSTAGTNSANDVFSSIVLAPNHDSEVVDVDFGEILPASLAGRTWGEDPSSENGTYDPGDGDQLLAGVTVTLTGTDDLGDSVTRTTTTDALGEYLFDQLRPGTYVVTQSQPAGWATDAAYLGTGATTAGAIDTSNRVTGVELVPGDVAVDYDFSEVIRTNVRIAKAVVPAPAGGIVGRNTTFTWRITVTNDGPSPATNVQVVDDLAALAEQHLVVEAVTPAAGTTCSPWTQVAAPNLTCTVTALAASGAASTATIDLTVRAASQPAATDPQDLVNDVAITAVDQPGNDPADDAATSVVQVRDADLGVVKAVDQASRFVGERATWTMVVTNNGPGTEPAARLTDQLPDQAAFVSVQTTRGTCALVGTALECELGRMVSGDTATITLVTVLAEAGTYRNVATVSSPSVDRTPDNQTSTAIVRVREPNAEDCTIEDGSGDGQLVGTPGNDVICGGGGADTIVCSGGNDIIVAGGGNDTITCTPSQCAGGRPTIIGGTGDDAIRVTCPGAVIVAGVGDDTIDAAGSNGPVTLCGNEGNDTITGGRAGDTLVGGPGIDTIRGGAGNDRIYGITGADLLWGDAGNDRIYGGVGGDRMDGGAGNDLLFGEAGNDRVTGGRGRDKAHGGDGNDQLRMRDRAPDQVIGGRGRDTIWRDRGVDRWASVEVVR